MPYPRGLDGCYAKTSAALTTINAHRAGGFRLQTKAPMHNVNSPRTDDSAIEQEIQAKGKTAPRVTPADLQANIASEFYFTAAEGVLGASEMGTAPAGRARALELLTFCVLVLKNGFTATGESACASPENFDAEIGRKIARQNAEQKIWPLMGYALKEKLAAQAQG